MLYAMMNDSILAEIAAEIAHLKHVRAQLVPTGAYGKSDASQEKVSKNE
jgi:hypothetical protein